MDAAKKGGHTRLILSRTNVGTRVYIAKNHLWLSMAGFNKTLNCIGRDTPLLYVGFLKSCL